MQMGGHALGYETKRLNLFNYLIIQEFILKTLSHRGVCAQAIKQVPGKTDFGDLDILVCVEGLTHEKLCSIIEESFSPSKLVSNGPVYSFDHQDFQIDFICVGTNEDMKIKRRCLDSTMSMAAFNFNYGDVGAIIGRMVSGYDLKFGEVGLWINLYAGVIENTEMPTFNSKHTLGKIVLSTDPQEICKFLGLDYDVYQNGFGSTREIYEWLSKCRFVSNVAKMNQKRLSTRNMFLEFLDFLKSHGVAESPKLSAQREALIYFNKLTEAEAMYTEAILKKKRKEKFSANIFLDRGVPPKDLTKVMSEFRDYIQSKYKTYLELWVDDHECKEIMNEVGEFMR